MKLVIFGTGDYYRKTIGRLQNHEIVALLDNNPSKTGTVLNGVRISLPKNVSQFVYDYIVVLSLYETDMIKQLSELGVKEDRIIPYSRLFDDSPIKLAEEPITMMLQPEMIGELFLNRIYDESILMMAGNLDRNGATIAFVHAAIMLQQNRYRIIFVSAADGRLKQILYDNGIPVIVDPSILTQTAKEIKWTEGFKKIICNTLLFYRFLSDKGGVQNIMWWLHDPAIFYKALNEDVIRKIDEKNMMVYAVGPVAEEAIRHYHPKLQVRQLLYGVPDVSIHRKKREERICFVTIANVQEYKGQDLIVDALFYLAAEEREQIQICIIGNQDSGYATELITRSAGLGDAISFMPEIGREEVNEYLDRAEVLICPSRVDCMPVSVTEAMQHGVPVIISDSIGSVQFIRDEVNGLIFDRGDYKMLAEKIRWCICHRRELVSMGTAAKEVYQKFFSMDVFRKHFLLAVKESLY